MASNSTDPSTKDDDEYQAGYEDEEDDERTIEEEEQLGSDEEQNELDDLEASANMPLDELLKLYSQNAPFIHNIVHHDDQSNTSSDDDDDVVIIDRRPQFHHLLQVNGQLLPDDDDGNETDDSFEPEIIKSINIGDEYQAQVEQQVEFGLTNGHCDDREVPNDELLWSPSSLNDNDNEIIDEYLKTICNEYPLADDEISLQTLLNCQMNTELALVKFRQSPVKTIYSYPEWSSDEIQRFEEGLREYGKNFFQISVFIRSNRSVREIVHYYYQWKKSDRYQLFIEEQKRLNDVISVTDMIVKLIEDQEQQLCTAIGGSNSTNSSPMPSNDLKRTPANSSSAFVSIRQQETTTTITRVKRPFDQVDHETELLSKKPSFTTNASPKTTIV